MIPPFSFHMDFRTTDKNNSTIKRRKVLKCHFNFNFFNFKLIYICLHKVQKKYQLT